MIYRDLPAPTPDHSPRKIPGPEACAIPSSFRLHTRPDQFLISFIGIGMVYHPVPAIYFFNVGDSLRELLSFMIQVPAHSTLSQRPAWSLGKITPFNYQCSRSSLTAIPVWSPIPSCRQTSYRTGCHTERQTECLLIFDGMIPIGRNRWKRGPVFVWSDLGWGNRVSQFHVWFLLVNVLFLSIGEMIIL